MHLPNPPAAVIFDLDGTLVDTAEEFVVVVQQLRLEHGLDSMEPALIRASVSNGARALVTLALNVSEHASGFEQKRLRLLQIYSGILGSTARPYPGIEELLRELGRRNIPWGIATNKPRPYTEPLLEALSLRPAAGSVVCSDDVEQRKPHPESLFLNCRELGCDPTLAVYVGDHQRDIEAGRQAGMYTIAASYGYIEAHDNPADWGADAIADDSRGLQAMLLPDR